MSRPKKSASIPLMVLVVALFLLFPSCSGPTGPAAGSPEWLYLAARDSWKGGDADKTQIHLEKIEDVTGNPYQARAVAWDVLVKSGRLLGYEDLVDSYAAAAVHAKDSKMNFVRDRATMLKEIKTYSLHLIDACNHFDKAVTGPTVELDFVFPDGSGAPIVEAERMEKGIWPVENERLLITDKMLKRGLVRAISAAVTDIDDIPGAQKAMASGKVSVPTARFRLAIAQSMSTVATYFDDRHIGEPDKRKFFLERTIAEIKKIQDLKPDADIEKTAKKIQDSAEKDLKKKS